MKGCCKRYCGRRWRGDGGDDYDANQKTKDNYFETFREYLNYLSVNELDSYMQQLKEHGYTFNQNLIRTYLTEVKRQSAAFVTNLKAAVQ